MTFLYIYIYPLIWTIIIGQIVAHFIARDEGMISREKTIKHILFFFVSFIPFLAPSVFTLMLIGILCEHIYDKVKVWVDNDPATPDNKNNPYFFPPQKKLRRLNQ